MLEHSRLPSSILLLDGLSHSVDCLHLDPFVPPHLAIHSWERQATLCLNIGRRARIHNLGVHQRNLLGPLLRISVGVEDHDSLVDSDLRRCQAHPVARIHDHEELLDRLLEVVVEDIHLGVVGTQFGVRVLEHPQVRPLDLAGIKLLPVILDHGVRLRRPQAEHVVEVETRPSCQASRMSSERARKHGAPRPAHLRAPTRRSRSPEAGKRRHKGRSVRPGPRCGRRETSHSCY
mmetsp:Transcript_5731/g.11123  ORF Transcript_5731/g.11123 Transcript_5731/m.11123 type:complete len:233 (+) Transcript_5731:299-997(+)